MHDSVLVVVVRNQFNTGIYHENIFTEDCERTAPSVR